MENDIGYSAAVIDGIKKISRVYVGDSVVRKTGAAGQD